MNQKTDARKRFDSGIDYQLGSSRNRQRQTETTTTTRMVEDLAEAEQFSYRRVEADYGGAWKAGVNIALVTAVGIAVAALTAVIMGYSLAWLPVTIVVALPAAVAFPAAVMSVYSLRTMSAVQRSQYIDAQATRTVSQRRYVDSHRRLVESATDAEYRIEDVRRRTESRRLAMAAGSQDDLRQFAAGVCGRGESPSFRNWRERKLASGKSLTHGRWKAELVGPLVAVGALAEPDASGKPYEIVDADYGVVESKLVEAGYLE